MYVRKFEIAGAATCASVLLNVVVLSKTGKERWNAGRLMVSSTGRRRDANSTTHGDRRAAGGLVSAPETADMACEEEMGRDWEVVVDGEVDELGELCMGARPGMRACSASIWLPARRTPRPPTEGGGEIGALLNLSAIGSADVSVRARISEEQEVKK